MTEINQAIASGGPFREGGEAALEVGGTDVLLALVTFAASLAVLGYGLSAFSCCSISQSWSSRRCSCGRAQAAMAI